jgi:hypothetical protein
MAWLPLALLGTMATTSLALPISSAEHEATWTAWKREHKRAYSADEVRPRDKYSLARFLDEHAAGVGHQTGRCGACTEGPCIIANTFACGRAS